MAEIIGSAGLWVLISLTVFSTLMRAVMNRMLGRRVSCVVYLLLTSAALVNLVWVYLTVPKWLYFWPPNPDFYWLAKLTMPLACVMVAGGMMLSLSGLRRALFDWPEGELGNVTGVMRITRHPVHWAVVLWAGGHMVANGDVVSVVFFGSFIVLSFSSTFLLDKNNAAVRGDAWGEHSRITSNFPFWAIIKGKNQLHFGELIRPAYIGSVVFIAATYFHEGYTGAIVF